MYIRRSMGMQDAAVWSVQAVASRNSIEFCCSTPRGTAMITTCNHKQSLRNGPGFQVAVGIACALLTGLTSAMLV